MLMTINGKEITTDIEGRFSLNDLHKAAGANVKDLPNKFMRSKSFKDVVEILIAQNRAVKPMIRKSGRYGGGTRVCKELVYKYAMWTNPEFEVKVIQTFDKLTSKINPPSSMAALNELSKKIMSDKDVASFCGKELSRYRTIKKENEEAFEEEVKRAQLTLGFN